MAEVTAIKGLESLVAKLRAKAVKAAADGDVSVVVGYTQSYAAAVHENLLVTHGQAFNVKHAAEIKAGLEHSRGPTQQAKFLEQPARENRADYARDVETVVKAGKTLAQALLVAGLHLQRDSQELVPVDTGLLRASAFTRLEKK